MSRRETGCGCGERNTCGGGVQGSVPMPPPAQPIRDPKYALLELKLAASTRRLHALYRDLILFLALALLILPLLLRQFDSIPNPDIRQFLAITIAAALIGIPAWLRERRERRAETLRRERIYLAMRPDVFDSEAP